LKQTKFTSWSFSRYSDYKLCPLKAKLSHLDKIREPKNPAMQRGADIHDQARDYIKGILKKLPKDLSLVKDRLTELKVLYKRRVLSAIIEDDWAFTKRWERTKWDDWAECVLRVKLDAAHFESDSVMIVTDWKTGKFREELHEEYMEQLELYALAALILYPHVETVAPRLVYTDMGVEYPKVPKEIMFVRADVPKLKRLWEKRVRPMMNDTKFAPRPNAKCVWCWYGQSKKSKGGPGLCKF